MKIEMNGTGDFICENDYNKFGSFDDICPREDREIKPTAPEQRYEKTLLTSPKKSFIFLERQSLIDCLEVDEDYIISAGRDHDINVWDVVEGKHIRRLCGHHAPVTGLSLFDSRHSLFDKIVVSSSEDGSVRIWSLRTGEELNKVETGNVITCMGVMDKSLAVTGNHKGYMEVRHLRGELYTSVRAHEDPIDALEVHDNYACTATFEAPSCLKIWVIQFEGARCIYSIENTPEIEFCCMTIWNKKVVLGSSNQPKLFVINFEDKSMAIIDLERSCEKVQRVKVCNGWIISCSLHSIQKRILLDVHRLHNHEHLGTFVSNVQIVKAIASIELYSTFKIALGGSALEILSFELNVTHEETNILASRLKYMPLLDDCSDRNSISSADDDSEDETSFDCDKKIGETIQSNYNYMHMKQENDELGSAILPEKIEDIIQSSYDSMHIKQENDELGSPILPEKIKTLFHVCFESRVSTPLSNDDKSDADVKKVHVKTVFTTPPKRTQTLSVLTVGKKEACNQCIEAISPTQNITEPRVALKKLKAEVDKILHYEDLEITKITENEKENNNNIVLAKANLDIKLMEDGTMDNVKEIIELENNEDHMEEIEIETTEHLEINTDVKETSTLPILKEIEENITMKQDIREENIKLTFNIDENLKKKNNKKKKDTGKKSQKAKHRKCQIM